MNKRILRIVLGDRTIAYHPYLARVMGSVAGGVWLSQILYWDSVKASGDDYADDAENWFYKTDAEIIGETGLTKRETVDAKNKARSIGIVKTELRGMPAKTHYCVDVDSLENQIRATSLHNAGQQVDTMPVNKLVQNHAQNLPQITTEITTEITTTGTGTAAPKIEIPQSQSPVKAEPAIEDDAPIPLDPQFGRVCKKYQDEIGLLTPTMSETLSDALNDYPADWICDAIGEATRANVRKWKYAAAILARWKTDGRGDKRDNTENGQTKTRKGAINGQSAIDRINTPIPEYILPWAKPAK